MTLQTPSPSPVRVACVGAGYFAQFQYQAWTRISDARLVGCANRTLTKAEETAAAYDIPAAFNRVPEMLAQTTPDVLDIITPPETHLAAIRDAANAGVDVICQKPFCQTADEARAAIACAEEAQISVVIHENFRFQPWYREIKTCLLSGQLGDIYHATFRLRPGDGQGADAYLARQPYFQKMPRFLVHETAIHFIDTFRFLLGEVSHVYADLRRLNPVISGEDAGLILFDFDAGPRAVFDGNRLADHAADNTRLTMGELQIDGSDASLRLDGFGRIFIRAHGSSVETEHPYTWRNEAFGGDCVFNLQQAYLAARLMGDAHENTAQDYLRNIAIEEAVYASSARGCKVSV